ncbi:MAG: DUF1501 domain-containing protein [Planctomycetaceae bacterium]|nr:DUF1501 domain-containing protein [Planctomycetaceae bacterium]
MGADHVHPNDPHATILYALGIDQHSLYHTHHGHKELVTVNGGKIIGEVFG